nr:MBL fold metallo-hydrolase [Actinomycetota bacterium]
PGEPVGASLGDLRATVDPLKMDEQAFVAWAVARTTDRPPNYVSIIGANMGRSDVPPSMLHYLEAGPNRCSA